MTPFSYFNYANNTKLMAMTAIPPTRPYMDKCVSSYLCAAGNNSSNEIKTIMPATPANTMPNITSVKKGIRSKNATSAPTGSANPDKKIT